MARVETLVISGDPDRWRSLGLTVTDDGLIPLYGTSLRIVAPTPRDDAAGDEPQARRALRNGPGGVIAWELSGTAADTPDLVDGLPTTTLEQPPRPVFADHDLGAVGLDHLVVLTGDLDRTSTAIAAATGCELKRIRDLGSMRQGFHRIGGGGLIVEIVERPEVEDDDASFWGVVINVDDLDAACELLGDDIGAPKDAVQPGRRIATVRDEAGLGLPVALMTP